MAGVAAISASSRFVASFRKVLPAEMTDSGWFAAGAAHLLFVHLLDDDFVAAPECMCRRRECQGEQQNNACRFQSIRFDRSDGMHFLRLSVSVQMSVQNSKYTEARPP